MEDGVPEKYQNIVYENIVPEKKYHQVNRQIDEDSAGAFEGSFHVGMLSNVSRVEGRVDARRRADEFREDRSAAGARTTPRATTTNPRRDVGNGYAWGTGKGACGARGCRCLLSRGINGRARARARARSLT